MPIPIIILITFLISLIPAFILAKSRYRAECQRLARKLRRAEAVNRHNSSEAERILGSIELGVIAYNSEGRLVTANRAARILIPRPPKTFRDFLEVYGQDPGFRSSVFLGSPLAITVYRRANLSLRLQVQTRDGGPADSSHLVLLQDYSRQDKEERMRKEFVANVSHELKTPLTTIKTYTESLLDWGIEEKSTEAIKKDLQRVYDDSLRMEKLISDLLLLSSLDASGLHTSVEQADPAWLIRQTCDRMQDQASAKKISLTCDVMNRIPPVYLDRAAFERILTNLISNALKYSPDSTQVAVYVGAVREEVYFKVKDQGFGIAKEDQAHLFDRFFRVDQTGSRQHGGTGLGLSIVKELVDLHRARISLESSLGQGTEFTVMLPTAKKVLTETLSSLVRNEQPEDLIQAAAAKDLTALARQIGIVAKWTSMTNGEKQALERMINLDSRAELLSGQGSQTN